MAMRNSVAPFEPDPSFAAGWFVDEPVAQGALKYASIAALDLIAGAREAAEESEADELGPLVIFPATVRGILTPRLIDRIELATIIVGSIVALSVAVLITPGFGSSATDLDGRSLTDIAGAGLIPNPATVRPEQRTPIAYRVEETCVLGEPLPR
jgi:hypothetical protein